MKRLALATAVLAIAVAIFVALTVPPARLLLPNPSPDASVAGIIHVHTSRSDGQSGVEAIAAAAARAGLKFVVFTDHGDATAPPEPPAYQSGVLCVDAVEISTAGGHYIALDMPAAPYPLAGEPRDVVEDVHRLGGFGIVAHPDSPKPDLRWRDWDLPFDAIETVNLDTGWRVWAQRAGASPAPGSTPPPPGGPSVWRARGRLAAALFDYPFRPAETIAGLMPGNALMAQYHELTRRRRVVSTAGADAHAKLEYRGDGTSSGSSLPIPGYEPTFRAMSVHVTPERPFTGDDAAEDAHLLMQAIRDGHIYTTIDAVATPASIEFTATNDGGAASAGDVLTADGPLTLRVRSNAPTAFATTVWNGAGVLSGNHHEQEFTVQASGDPGTYWVSIGSDRGNTEAPAWIRTNPIYVRGPELPAPLPATRPSPAATEVLFDGKSDAGWQIEHDPHSPAALDRAQSVNFAELRLRYALAGGAMAGQFVGLVHDLPTGVAVTNSLALTIRSEQPMRVSVQLRVPASGANPSERWQRSIYVDATPREYVVRFDDLTPVGTTHTAQPAFADVRSLLFVIDTINTKPAASGRLWLQGVALEK